MLKRTAQCCCSLLLIYKNIEDMYIYIYIYNKYSGIYVLNACMHIWIYILYMGKQIHLVNSHLYSLLLWTRINTSLFIFAGQ